MRKEMKIKKKVIMRIKQRNRFKKDSKDMRNVCY